MATQPHSPRHSNGNGHRDARELEHDIQRTRSEMDETINRLSERLSPRRLMDEVYDYFRSSASSSLSSAELADQAKSIGRSAIREIKNHPVPAALMGAGLLWLLFEDDESQRRDFHSQWADIPEYSGSFVDARTGEPYDVEAYTTEWRQEVPAWHPSYDWSKSDVNEQSWTERAKQSLDDIKATLSDTTKPAREKMRHTASRIMGLTGHKQREMRARWANLRSHSGSFVDARTGQPYDESYGREWQAMMACDYCATKDWTPEEEASWTEKAQHALEEMQQSLADSSGSAKEQLRSLAAKIGDFMGSASDFSGSMAQSLYDRASQTGSSIQHGAMQAGHGLQSGARYVGRKTRTGGVAMQRQVHQGYAASRDAIVEAMDEYPIAAGAAFLGLGLLLGFALPRTRYEDRLMGDTSDDLKQQAMETGREAAERAKHVAAATAAAAMDETERQGLTPHQLGEKAQRVASKVQSGVQQQSTDGAIQQAGEKLASIAERAVQTAKEETKKEARDMKS